MRPRLEFQKPGDIHVLGYTADLRDVARSDRLRLNYPEQRIYTPLITRGLTKERCLEMVKRAGIELPAMYKLGFKNNNCIPCVKAQGAGYWAMIREHFPEHFLEISEASLGRLRVTASASSLTRRIFLDELPADHLALIVPIQPSLRFSLSRSRRGRRPLRDRSSQAIPPRH